MIGKSIGQYQILAELGRGGMGEVYRARDTKLNRDVALKILPDVFAGDPDRLARFTREAETLAALNHPNIAHVYDAGKPDGASAHAYLVMELVEGEDLSAHIARGPMALSDALPIARQIAEALEAAHESAIVHRDLKPANVKVREDGTVKVLDFGLAKALDSGTSGPQDSNNSPTLTNRATQMGMIIGTAAYMAPEQARGRAVDRRADVWAFGVVLYEMLSGRRAFEGDDISITLASVLKEDVSWSALPADLPIPIRRLLRRCLEKDPKKRLSSIGDARLELGEAAAPSDRDGVLTPVAIAAAPPVVIPVWRRALPWGVAAAGIIAAVTTLVMWAPWRSSPAPALRKFLVKTGADASLRTDLGAGAILSPDGTTLVFVAGPSGAGRLFVRKLSELQAIPMTGTEGAASPFFSPDGESIAFFAGGKLKKVAVSGGAAIPLCDVAQARGGTWTDRDEIIFTPTGSNNVALLRVSASGGKPEAFGVLSEGATTQRWPHALPGDKGILFSESGTVSGWDSGNLVVAPIGGGTGKVVVRGGYYGRFVPSGRVAPNRADRADGHLLYMQQGSLFAVRFNLDRLETVGEARPALEGVTANISTGGAQIGFSADGTLVYVPGTAGSINNPIDWMTRDGKVSVLRSREADWSQPRFSPDGLRLALSVFDGKQRDVWVYDWARDAMQQLTQDPGNDGNPVWTPDNQRIVFQADREKASRPNLFWANADGTGEITRLTESPNSQQAWSVHPGGRFIAFQETTASNAIDLMILPLEGDPTRGLTAGKATVFLSTPVSEMQPIFSPDGRWIAYFSAESGQNEVHVRSFPGPGGHWRVTTDGGGFPRWSKTSNELFYLHQSQGKVMVVPYTVVGDSFRADKPQIWSPTNYVQLGIQGSYDVHPDGKRLALVAANDQAGAIQDQIVVISDFFDYLWSIAPGRK
ncbi:MAG: protein kinase [Acidobacteria bacterium]|nr:protein kinase [Acidobacteriota bacterium]